jgi:hypothetical protein
VWTDETRAAGAEDQDAGGISSEGHLSRGQECAGVLPCAGSWHQASLHRGHLKQRRRGVGGINKLAYADQLNSFTHLRALLVLHDHGTEEGAHSPCWPNELLYYHHRQHDRCVFGAQ